MSEIKLHKAPRRWPLVLISLDKFVKGIGLLVISFVLTQHWHDVAKQWVNDAQLTPHNPLVKDGLESMAKALGFQEGSLPLVRICVVIYAGLYLIEGVGLLYERKWAEWMVVIGTATFLPLELYDYFKQPRWLMVGVFVLNLLMAAYLVWRLHRQHVIERERKALSSLAVGKTTDKAMP